MGGSVVEGGGTDVGCRLTRDSAAIITSVDATVSEVLGWSPEDLVGRPSTEFIHPEDQASAVAAWFTMLAEPGGTNRWRGRYRSADGGWRWIEVVNVNRLDDPDVSMVISEMAPVSVVEVSVEEELRARRQMLAALADALPVGVWQFDLACHVTFSNERLHALIELESIATFDPQLWGLGEAGVLDAAVDAVLAGEAVDGLEVHVPADEARRARVFEASLRPLTAADGTVSGGIGCLADITDRVRLRESLEYQASRDALTGCLNRSAILERLDLLLDRLGESDDDGIAVLFVDLDEFKVLNDNHGHATGDRILVEASRRLTEVLRRDDALGRLGGDEFLAVCQRVTTEAQADELRERLDAAVRGPVEIANRDIAVRATVGMAWTRARMPRDLLVSEADHAMYRRKAQRRQRSVA